MNQIRNVTKSKYGLGLEGTVEFSLFKTDIRVRIAKGGHVEFAQKCANYLNSLSDKVIDHLCAASIRYCHDFCAAVGKPSKQFKSPRAVLGIVRPKLLIVPSISAESDPIVHMELDCEWEEEHGMEWLVRDDEVLYVGAYNGEDPMGDYTVKQSWNYA